MEKEWGRRSIRLRGFDYTQPGGYFVTICTCGRENLLGEVVAHEMRLNSFGKAVAEAWRAIPSHFHLAEIDAFAVMPNHIHGIIMLEAEVGAKRASPLRQREARGTAKGSLPTVVQSFKSAAARSVNQIRGTPGKPLWQRGYFERVIRGPDELDLIRGYIEQNPLLWQLDQENPSRT